MVEEALEQKSRFGNTKELLNFKTIITKPVKRCVGGFGRDINIFFLLAEALWIWTGQKDVEFLKFFNSRMIDFSDNGKAFHAPYGFRLRYYGQDSIETQSEGKFIDQILLAIKMFSENSEDRRVVLTLWNPFFDLGVKSKDLACNCMVMLKIRDNKLFTTVQNRSNDVHWGLPTNVFQFSFLSELMANCLGIIQGEQVHNSQSLHFYIDNSIAKNMYDSFEWFISNNVDMLRGELYSNANTVPLNFNFNSKAPVIRLDELDIMTCNMLQQLRIIIKAEVEKVGFEEELKDFSKGLFIIFKLLKIYIIYKHSIIDDANNTDYRRRLALESIEELLSNNSVYKRADFCMLARNFFYKRLNKRGDNFVGTF